MRFLLIFCLFSGLLTASASSDSLKQKLIHHPEDSAKLEIIKYIAFNYLYTEPDSAIVYCTMLLEAAQSLGHVQYQNLGYSYMSEAYLVKTDFSKALTFAKKALEISYSSEDTFLILTNYNAIGNIANRNRDFQSARENYMYSLAYAQASSDIRAMGRAYLNLGNTFNELMQLDSAYFYLQESLKIRNEIQDIRGAALTMQNLGVNFLLQKKQSEAVPPLLRSLEIFDSLSIDYLSMYTHNLLSEAYWKQNNFSLGEFHGMKAYELAREFNLDFELSFIAQNLSYLYTAMGKYELGQDFKQIYFDYRDSVQNIEKEKLMAEMRATYQVELKEAENQLLRETAEKSTAQIQLQRSIIGLILMVLIFLSAFVYFQNRVRKKEQEYSAGIGKKNEMIEQQNIELKKKNDEIISQRDELERINQVKIKLFSIISHDLKSPINSLQGFLMLLKSGLLSAEELEKMAGNLEEKIMRTSDLLDNLLKWARSQMDFIQVSKERFMVSELIEQNLELFSSIAEGKNINIKSVYKQDTAELIVNADKEMVNLTIRNFVSNAIKFSDRNSEIELIAGFEEGLVVVKVQDRGVGILPNQVESLFSVNPNVSKGTENEMGTGLGLYLCREFIEMNGGKIGVESIPGKGSCFYFKLPVYIKDIVGKQHAKAN